MNATLFLTRKVYLKKLFLNPILQMSFQWISGDKNITKLMPYNCYLPEFLTPFPQYIIYYIYIVYSANVVSCVLGSIDGGFAYDAFFISCIFKMIQFDIESIFQKYGERGDSYIMTEKDEIARLEYKLGVLIQRQNDTQKLSETVLKLFGVMIFVHFVTSAITICSVCVVILVGAAGMDLVSCLFYLSAISTQLFIYCYGASLIEDESSKIAEAAYASYWYHVDLRVRKIILIIINRSQKPIVLKVPFFVPSLPAFNAIMSTAGSYVALMKSFL
ncbi:Or22c.2 family protein [Megaselia abdita]